MVANNIPVEVEDFHRGLIDILCGDWTEPHERHGLSGPEGAADRIIDMISRLDVGEIVALVEGASQ